MGTDPRKALVVGAHGIVGWSLVEHLAAAEGWEVVSAGRRGTGPAPAVPYVQAELSDAMATTIAFAGLADVTHVFLAAYEPVADPREEVERNVAMLTNTIDGLERAGAHVRHVTIYQGGKAYGAHLGPFRTPAKESDPRVMGPLFYYDQEDVLRSRASAGDLAFTALRPDHICGIGLGGYVNLVQIVAVYASICSELGLPLRFPGSERAYDALVQATDAQLLARASSWAAVTPAAANEVFNVTNGDLFRFRHVWGSFADYFDLPLGDPLPFPLARYMPDKSNVWQALVTRHGLAPFPYEQLVNWTIADAILNVEHDIHSSTVKIRQAGFGDCFDTGRRFLDWFDEMRRRRLIPPGNGSNA